MRFYIAIAVSVLTIAASHYTAYKWGFNAARLEQAEDTSAQLAKAAQHIIDEQSKLTKIEDIIRSDTDNSSIKSPVLIRTLNRVSECSGKTHC